MNLLQRHENEQVAKLSAGKEIPDFQPGDTVLVNYKVVEGEKSRIQAYEGVCIGRSGGGFQENFTVRKISYGEGVERVFPLYSPMIDSIKVVRRGKVRRAKLYYLRGRRGKAARISERQEHRPVEQEAKTPGAMNKGAEETCRALFTTRSGKITWSMSSPTAPASSTSTAISCMRSRARKRSKGCGSPAARSSRRRRRSAWCITTCPPPTPSCQTRSRRARRRS